MRTAMATPVPCTANRWAVLVAATLMLSACANRPPAGNAPEPPKPSTAPAAAPAAPTTAAASAAPLSSPTTTPADAALAQGLKAYQGGRYTAAEAQFNLALRSGLGTPADVAIAHKHLAFIYCTSRREAKCAKAFKAARAADPRFALTKAEAGHPMWGPVYRKAVAPPRPVASDRPPGSSPTASKAAAINPRP